MNIIKYFLKIFNSKRRCYRCSSLISKKKIKDLYWEGHCHKVQFCEKKLCDHYDAWPDCGCDFCEKNIEHYFPTW